MLSYDIAKALKDAGFPQDKTEIIARKYSLLSEPLMFKRPPEGMELPELSGKLEWELAWPTLEELIEACPKAITEVIRSDGTKYSVPSSEFVIEHRDGDTWVAGYNEEMPYEGKFFHYDLIPRSPTPAEAVAKLWLEMNKRT